MANLAISQTPRSELISSAGESFKSSAYQLDWSMGECMTAMYVAGAFVMTQGFHQGKYVINYLDDDLLNIKKVREYSWDRIGKKRGEKID